MAFSPMRSLYILSKSFRVSPVNLKHKNSTSLNPSLGKTEDLLHLGSNNWDQITALSSPSAKNKIKRRGHVSRIVYSDLQFPRQSPVKHSEQIGCSSPGDVSVDTPDRLDLPKVIGSKIIKYTLGSGAFGTVIRGNYRGERIAVKVVPKRKISSLDSEANALQLNHVNIIRIFKIIIEKEYGLILMERNFGPNVHELLHQLCAPFSASDRIRYMLNIANALEHCHSLRILHLDVKPSNILLSTANNICKLCDFGCSVYVKDLYLFHLQKVNFGVNTVCYTDPQLLRGQIPSSKSDVYSFGITMWQVISREIPYEGIDCHTIIYKVVSENYRPREIHGTTKYDKRYIDLYQLCWKTLPGSRPEMKFVVEEMERILVEEKLERNF